MGIIWRKDITSTPPEAEGELQIEGTSIVLLDRLILERPLTDAEISNLCGSGAAAQVLPDKYHYVRGIFALSDTEASNHVWLRVKKPVSISPIEITNNDVVQGTVSVYVVIYAHQFVSFLTVAVIDRQGVTNHPSKLMAPRPLKTDDMLKMLDIFNSPDSNVAFELKNVRADLASELFKEIRLYRFPEALQASRRSFGMQIWNMANLALKPDDQVNGVDLAIHYAWELSALLSFYTEHVRRRGLWRSRRTDQIKREIKTETDVLYNHRVLANERICLEITQVNHPAIMPVSAERLYNFGFDSTSIFLWVYLSLQEWIIDYYETIAGETFAETQKELSHWLTAPPAGSSEFGQTSILKALIRQRLEVIGALYRHESLWRWCHEERHVKFLVDSARSKKLHEKSAYVKGILKDTQELFYSQLQMMIASEDTHENRQTNHLISEVKSLSEAQGDLTARLSLLNYVVACMAIAPTTDFILTFGPHPSSGWARLLVAGALAGSFALAYRRLVNQKSGR